MAIMPQSQLVPALSVPTGVSPAHLRANVRPVLRTISSGLTIYVLRLVWKVPTLTPPVKNASIALKGVPVAPLPAPARAASKIIL